MTVPEFAVLVKEYVSARGGRVTSWGRPVEWDQHNPGGVPFGPHNWWLAVDVVGMRWDEGTHTYHPLHCPVCSTVDLKVIHEPTHNHIQPMDFPAGPVHSYGGP